VIPENLSFGGGVSHSTVNPLVGGVVLIVAILMLRLQLRNVIAPFLAAALLIPMDQVLVIGSLHFTMLRVLILFGFVRMISAKGTSGSEIFSGGMNGIDKAMLFFAVFTAVDGALLWQTWGAVNFQLGNVYETFGLYFLLRFLIRDQEDVVCTIRQFAYIAAVLALIMVNERLTGRNPYALLGGARASVYGSLMERGDGFRAMGSFGHSILAGTFGAILLPLFIGLWWKDKKYRLAAVVGIIAATLIPIASNSSTPLLAYIAGLLALGLWSLRKHMRILRWGIAVTLISLHLVMKAPVWNLIARIDLTGGSSSEHRYQLMDAFIRHFGDWWLIGTRDNAQWGWDMWDTANQYIGKGESSGLLPLIFFLATIIYGFKYIGKAREAAEGNKRTELVLWAFGAALFSNVVAFFGISYWDQTIVVWYGLLAIIAAATIPMRQVSSVAEPVQEALATQTAAFAPGGQPKSSIAPYSPGRFGSTQLSSKKDSFPDIREVPTPARGRHF
jgi:hypothetical protein